LVEDFDADLVEDFDYVDTSQDIFASAVNLANDCDFVEDTQADHFLSDLIMSPAHEVGESSNLLHGVGLNLYVFGFLYRNHYV